MKPPKYRRLLTGLLAPLTLATAYATSIPLTNPSFEVPNFTVPSFTNSTPGWESSFDDGSAFIEWIDGFSADGKNHLGIKVFESVTQTLATTVAPNTVYTLTVALGNRSGWTDSNTRAQWSITAKERDGNFFYGPSENRNLTEINSSPGTFRDAPSITFNSQQSPQTIGSPLIIGLGTTFSGRAHFDNVRLKITSELVTSSNDSGPGSLRQAIADAESGDTIIFDPAVFNGELQDVIKLNSPLVIADKDLSIDASPIGQGVTIDARDLFRVLEISGFNKSISLTKLNLVNGLASGNRGGGVFDNGQFSKLSLDRCSIIGCNAGTTGGAIWNQGNLTLISTTLASNGADEGGGAFACPGGSSAKVINCTIVNNFTNDVGSQGGGINCSNGSLSIENSILARNSSTISGNLAVANDLFNLTGNSLQLPAPNFIGAVSGDFPTTGYPNADGHYIGNPDQPLSLSFHPVEMTFEQITSRPKFLGHRAYIPLPLPSSTIPALSHDIIQTKGKVTENTPVLDQLGTRRNGLNFIQPIGQSTGIGAIQSTWGQGLRTGAPDDLSEIADITHPGDVIRAYPSLVSDSPGFEGVENAIDNNNDTKFLDFGKQNIGFDVTPFVTSHLRGISLTSANDEPDRDPSTVIIYGKKKNGEVEIIRMIEIPTWLDPNQAVALSRKVKQTFYFDQATDNFEEYRVVFPTVLNPNSANSMQIAEVELIGSPADRSLRVIDWDIRYAPDSPDDFLPYKLNLTVLTEPNQTYGSEYSIDLENWTPLHSDKMSTGFKTTFFSQSSSARTFNRFFKED